VEGHRGYLSLAQHVKISAYRRQFESTPHGRGAALFRKSPAIYLNRGVKDIFIACVDGLKHVVLPFILRMKVAQGRTDRPCKQCEEQGVAMAPLPPRIIDKSLVADAVIIDTIVSKYAHSIVRASSSFAMRASRSRGPRCAAG
jgi:hypothetical protein